ncbi:hydroxymethylbilane synthase [Alteriqipengyuania lutimaris]|uniref:Porphobilinogen deaminase n=1 Tax=Alteriqipengyuania lutimaris TaxID=1538146 RepID=A0A395LJL3_9SPHN|nr:hydroxymethylbilane synthase [Alteriqipengyuania lutimaris]MBB3033918.1 hydroxymethylbilane synthase [Alteriqipengyuania lutimaris]RDS77122.1 hydroxymethylbilane synthase [Alteriqipengyuania lutimaris]
MQSEPLLKLGTRRSPLAMAQAHETRSRLCKAHGWDESAVEIVPVVAGGDKIQDRPLAEVGGKALWTRELDQWLAEGRIDVAVHSLKDVETLRPERIALAAILPRADRRDVLLGAGSIAAIPQGARLGTSAPRRAAQMKNLRPDIEVVLFRGNVATRMAKLQAGEADVTLLAAAGLERLGERGVGTPLEVDDWLPAPSQGAIGIECRSDDERVRELFAAIDHAETRAEIAAERGLLEGLGGSCHSPVGVLAQLQGKHIHLTAALFSEDGAERVDAAGTIAVGDDDAVRAFAADLLARATPGVAALFGGAD